MAVSKSETAPGVLGPAHQCFKGRTVGKEWEPETIFDVLGSERARRILSIASVRPVSAEQLASAIDTSLPTVYRRVNALVEYDLLRENTNIDEEGNHYKTYETNLQRVCFEVSDGGFTVDIQLRRDMVDQFQDFWTDLEGGDDAP